jgi:hypothetical protein
MEHFKRSTFGVVGVALALALVACPGPTPSPSGDFSLRLDPSNPGLAPGGTSTASVRITRNNGFAGAIQLSLENAPSGVTATFDPNPATADVSAVTLEAPKTLAAGNYTVQIKGVSGATSNTTSVTVAVAPVPPSTVTVDTGIQPKSAPLPTLDGQPRPLAAMVDAKGMQTDFVQNEVLFTTDDSAALNAFLTRWKGTVLRTLNPPPGLNLKPTHVIRVDASAADTNTMPTDLQSIDPSSRTDLKISSLDGHRLLALTARERVQGAKIGVNLMMEGDVFSDKQSIEANSQNAMEWTYMTRGGNQRIGVADAWRLLERAGKLGNTIRIGIVDGGFDPNIATHGDFPADLIVDQADLGANQVNCSGGNPCPWHGTGAALTAAGMADNNFGAAGPAGPVASLALSEYTGGLDSAMAGLFEVFEDGARIINMSFGGSVAATASHLVWDFEDVTEALFAAGRLVFASAGNANRNVDAKDCFGATCWEERWYYPCENNGVICVGGLANDSRQRIVNSSTSGSNYGLNSVDIFAPWPVNIGPTPANPGNIIQGFGGTSAASPFAAGVAALIWAANPNLPHISVLAILMDQAHTDTIDTTVERYVNAYGGVKAVLGNQPPEITLTAPLGVTQVNLEFNLINLKVNVDDIEGGDACCPVTWTSNLDGNMGSGKELSYSFKTLGTHTVTATTTDNGGLTDSVSKTVFVVNNPPTAEILNPSNNQILYRDQNYPFEGTAIDGVLDVPCNALTWKSSKAGEGPWTGCMPTVKFTSNGTRTITLSATDALGAIGQDSVTINITDLPPSGPPQITIKSPKNGGQYSATSNIRLSYSITNPGGGAVTEVWKLKMGNVEKTIIPKLCTVQVGGTPFAYKCFKLADYGYTDNGVKLATLSLTVTDVENLSDTDTVTFSFGEVP